MSSVILRLRSRIKRLRRAAFEAVGSARYSRPALHQLDQRLERHINLDHGFFVEAGANDGFSQSNTYYLERFRGWTGILVEPIPELAAECRLNRMSPVFEAAFVADELTATSVTLHCAGLMSTVAGALGDAEVTRRHIETGLAVQRLRSSRTLQVPARTLSSLLDEQRIDREIDLLSLDVEGAEPQALRGLDLRRHSPRWICVEARDPNEIHRLLDRTHQLKETLTDLGTHLDLLYARR
jgi:FkbM family methyltransferase